MPDEVKTVDKDLDMPGEVPTSEGEEYDLAFIQARDLISSLVKTIKAFRLYPTENPSLASFREQIFRKFQDFLRQHHSFYLKVQEYTLSFNGKPVYENRDLKTSLAFLMFKDGFRELRFMEGLELWELEGLIDILKRTESINQMEDDLVTLMWERDFVHISYLATDVFLDEMAGMIPENLDQFRQNLISEGLAQNVSLDLLDEEELQADKDYYEILSQKVERPPALETNRNVYFLTPEELERLRKEVDAEVSTTAVFNVIDIVFEILAIEKNQEPFQDGITLLMKLLDALLTLGEFQKAADLLTRSNIILKTYELKDWQVEAVQKLIDHGGDSELLEKISSFLEKGQGIRWEEVNNYLLLLPPKALPALIKVLGEIANSKARRLLCDVIVQLGKNHLEMVLPFTDDSRWYLVRNIAYILGRIGKEQALPGIQKMMTHREVRVRREAVQALGFIGGPKAFGLLVKALGDEDVRVRSIAALNLAKVGKDESHPYLLDIIQSKEFAKKEPAEKKAFLDAIGMIDPGFSPKTSGKKGGARAAPSEAKGKPPETAPSREVLETSKEMLKPAVPLPARPGVRRRETGLPLGLVSAKRAVAVKRSGFGGFIWKIFHLFSPPRKR